MTTLFFSYSHKDEAFRADLEESLAMIKRDGLIDAWHYRKITAGDDLDDAIHEKLEEASVIVLLVSPSFLSSDYCYDVEVARAMERHKERTARVIPVLIRPCEWKRAPFGGLRIAPEGAKAVSEWENRDQAYLDITTKIRDALSQAPKRLTDKGAGEGALQNRRVGPFSRNTVLSQTFSEVDQDRFLDEAFDYLAQFFENSLQRLDSDNPRIDTRFKRITAESFTAIIYRDGKALSRCGIRLGGAFGKGITYGPYEQAGGSQGCSENLSPTVVDNALALKPMGMSYVMRSHNRKGVFNIDEAAEFYWSMLTEPLQR